MANCLHGVNHINAKKRGLSEKYWSISAYGLVDISNNLTFFKC